MRVGVVADSFVECFWLIFPVFWNVPGKSG